MTSVTPKKSALAIVLGPGKPSPDDAPAGGGDEDLEAAASDFLAAVTAKDPKALASAFRSMDDICSSYASK